MSHDEHWLNRKPVPPNSARATEDNGHGELHPEVLAIVQLNQELEALVSPTYIEETLEHRHDPELTMELTSDMIRTFEDLAARYRAAAQETASESLHEKLLEIATHITITEQVHSWGEFAKACYQLLHDLKNILTVEQTLRDATAQASLYRL